MTQCECSAAGYCQRHKCVKTPHWQHLCATNPAYYALWESGRGPGQTGTDEIAQSYREKLLERSHACWLALHTYRQPCDPWKPFLAERWYAEWRETIPSFSCSCRRKWAQLEADHPPRFDSEHDFILWGFEMHNRVRASLHQSPYSIGLAWQDRRRALQALSQ